MPVHSWDHANSEYVSCGVDHESVEFVSNKQIYKQSLKFIY